MPTPYTLSVSVDLWTTNTDQKLQILEQILMLFNPSLEIQTTDNYIDWTSISVLNIENINFSSRSIPTGTESEIDVATIGLQAPIFISPPAKVKKLGVITNIITAVFADTGLEVNIDETAYAQSLSSEPIPVNEDVPDTTKDAYLTTEDTLVTTSYLNYDIEVINNVARLIRAGKVGTDNWTSYMNAIPTVVYEPGITEIRLQRDNGFEITGTVTIDTADETRLLLNIDDETTPADTVITGPTGDRTTIDYVIDPTRYNPQTDTSKTGLRLLLLGPIGDVDNVDGANAWKNGDNTDFVASAYDIVEWDGNAWHIIFDASTVTQDTFVTNLNTNIQYKWTDSQWVKSWEGDYSNGTWRIV